MMSASTISLLFRRIPLLYSLLLSCIGLVALDQHVLTMMLSGLLLWILGYWLVSRKIWYIATGAAVCITSLHALRLAELKSYQLVVGEGKVVNLELTIVKKLSEKRYFARIDSDGSVHGARVMLDTPSGLSVGDVVEGECWLRRPRQARNPGGFDASAWLWREGISVVAIGQTKVVARDSFYQVQKGLEGAKVLIKEKLQYGLTDEDQIKVIHSMFLGERYGQDDPVATDYRLSGAMHVFAVSGLHVMLIGGAGVWLLRLGRQPYAVWVPGAIILMFAYTGVTGWGAPAIRASVMASFFLCGFLVRRKPQVMNSLAASGLAVLVWDSHQLFTVGFQLSYGVVIAIVGFGGFWSKRFAWMEAVEPFLPYSLYTKWQFFWLNFRSKIASSLSVSFAAWMGSAPLIAWYFKLLSPVGLLVGVPVVFSLACIMWLGFASVFLGSLYQPISLPFNKANGWVAAVSREMVGSAARAPWGHYKLAKKREESIEVFDMKGGAAVYLNLAGGVLIDVGSQKSGVDLSKALATFQRGVDSVVLSHADSQHVGATGRVLSVYTLKQMMVPELHSRSPVYNGIIEEVSHAGVPLLLAEENQLYQLGDTASIKVLFNGALHDGRRADDRGLVLMVKWKGAKVLLMNDAGSYVERCLLELGRDVEADIVVTGKPREEQGISEAFLLKTGAKSVIATEFTIGYAEQRSYAWKSMLERNGVTLYSQSETGAVSITQDKQGKCVFDTALKQKPL